MVNEQLLNKIYIMMSFFYRKIEIKECQLINNNNHNNMAFLQDDFINENSFEEKV